MSVIESTPGSPPAADGDQAAVIAAPHDNTPAAVAALHPDPSPTQPRPDPAGAGADPTEPGRTGIWADLLALTRPLQWLKNLLVIPLGMVAAPHWTGAGLARVGWSVLVFTLAATVVYVANDIADRHRDREHPTKRHRPIAAGRVPVAAAVLLGAALTGALGFAAFRGPDSGHGPLLGYGPVLAYIGLNLAYSGQLKHLPLIDVGVVAAGFVLRLAQGALAAGTAVPVWLLIAVYCLCLVLILGKRRSELRAYGDSHRPSLRGYSVEFLDHLIQLCCGLTVVTGLFYLSNGAALGRYTALATTVCAPFVLFGLARYLQVLLVHEGGGDPVRLLVKDRPLLFAAALWVVLLGAIVVLAREPGLANQLAP